MAFPDLYGRLVGKRLDAAFFLEDPAGGTHACDYLFTVDMEMEPVDGYAFTDWEQGYGDVHLVPDLATLRICSWLDRTVMVLCSAERGHEPVAIAPRSILDRQLERAADAGYHALAASELEYFLYRNDYVAAARDGYRDLTPAGWYIEDYHLLQGTRTEDVNGAFRRHLSASGIPVESTKGEWGRGQHEVNIKYADVRTMADRHVVLKHACKEIAESLGSAVTFMAKPDAAEAGSSSHLHLSLWRSNANVFNSDETFRHFLGGWMAHAADLMVCLAPTINSYKRYQSQSWAPTAVAWSNDNRTTGFRIVGEGPGKRIECRIPGADVNPYLAYAAALASGLDGIENETEPPPMFEGDAYSAADLPAVPRTLAEAVDRFDQSAFARTAFGDEVVDHYTHFFRTEVHAYDAAVTDWERRRYFERI
ncbi:glutamine synthetase family protein [Actinospongicola halichondriae]|uniref:glutamine synthetase family protein n=1 Tax=Actinospongicola halichondriae TaxID=3236844 RepID=UPI003D3A19FA